MSVKTFSKCARVSFRTLVVEDDEINQEVIAAILTRLGCYVEVVANGMAALEKLKSSSYDLIFIDWHMPGMDGLETTIAIRSKESLKDQPSKIIAMTAYSMREEVQRHLNAGMDDCIFKPATIGDFEAVLERQVS